MCGQPCESWPPSLVWVASCPDRQVDPRRALAVDRCEVGPVHWRRRVSQPPQVHGRRSDLEQIRVMAVATSGLFAVTRRWLQSTAANPSLRSQRPTSELRRHHASPFVVRHIGAARVTEADSDIGGERPSGQCRHVDDWFNGISGSRFGSCRDFSVGPCLSVGCGGTRRSRAARSHASCGRRRSLISGHFGARLHRQKPTMAAAEGRRSTQYKLS